MQRSNFFLRTKLLPPRPVSDLLARPRLTKKLNENLNMPMTLVTADAGCGKTTLVAEFVRAQGRELIWYQLDYTDADPFVFLGYICHGIKRFAPNFGETILPYLSEANDELLRFPERAVDLLLNEILETLEQPFILVLDDYHHIGRETTVHKLVDRLLQYASDTLHVIITTRDLPPLAIVKRRSQQSVLVVTRDDLLFTDDEMRELFRQTLGIELQPADVAEYREKTHGWVTALQLVRQVAEGHLHSDGHAPEIDLKNLLRQSEKDIFDYFAEEVFAAETPATAQLLLHLSLLDALPLDVCSQLFPELRTAAALPVLVQRNVFVTVAGEAADAEVYRFHPLFRDFLQRRLRTEIGRAAVAAERTRIAEFFLSRQQWESSLSQLLEAENYERAAEIIARRGAEWISNGAITTLGLYADRVPVEFLEKFPRSLVNRAEVARLQGDAEKSTAWLHRAIQFLSANGDTEDEAEAWHSLATIFRRRGEYDAALQYLEKAEKLVGENSEVRMKSENTRGLCFVATGAWTNAERQFRLALELAEKRGNEHYIRLITHNLALPYGFRGDFAEALRWLRRIFSQGTNAPIPQEAIGHLNIARLHLYRGEMSDAEPHLERSLELCQLYNLNALRGEILEAYGNFYREKNDFPHASEFYERARKSYEDAGIDLSVRELNEERARLALIRNDAATAKNLLENLLEKRTANRNEAGVRICQLELCRTLLKIPDSNNLKLIIELTEVLDYFHAHQHFYYEVQTSLALAIAHFKNRERTEMLPPLQRTLDLTARYDYEYWLRGEIRQNAAFFSDESVNELLPSDLRPVETAVNKKLPATVEQAESELIHPAASAPQPVSTSVLQTSEVVDLTLKLLGPIEIYRDPSKRFAADAWTTRRARDIFCFIAGSRHHRVDKDILIETFWGESDFAAVEKNFHPTISHIRKALNNKQTLKQNFLLYRDGAYQLNGELSYSIDSEDFERLITEAENYKKNGDDENFRNSLESAHGLYRGEFLTGVYEDWADEQRKFYREQFLRVLNGLAKASFKERNWAAVLRFANDILREDQFREDVHCLIMRVHAAQGKRAAVKDQYENLRSLLKQELGVEPAPETRRIYQELFK